VHRGRINKDGKIAKPLHSFDLIRSERAGRVNDKTITANPEQGDPPSKMETKETQGKPTCPHSLPMLAEVR